MFSILYKINCLKINLPMKICFKTYIQNPKSIKDFIFNIYKFKIYTITFTNKKIQFQNLYNSKYSKLFMCQ